MNAFVIEVAGERKRAFVYDRPLNGESEKALDEYARASFGDDALLRRMTPQEEHEFKIQGVEFFNLDV
jgi:hypothetical protein